MWKTVKLGDVCDFQNGFAFKSALFKERGKPILRISNIQNEKIDVRKTVYFDAKDYDTDFTRYEVKPDDLLIAMSGATTGKIGFNKTDTTYYLNQRVGKFKPKPTLDKVFLYYLLSTKVQENLSISKGAAQPNLSSEQIKNISFPLPPLAEQQRIVAKLDAAFAEIDVAIVVTNKNTENAKAAFEKYLIDMFENKRKNWKTESLKDVSSNITDGKHGDCKNQPMSGYYFLSAKDVRGGTLNYNGAREIVKYDFDETHRRTNLEPGDVLITNSGTIGRMAIAPESELTAKTTFQKSVAIIKPRKDKIESIFLYFSLSSKLSYFQKISQGAAQKNLLLRDLRAFDITYPVSIDEQLVITEKMKSISTVCNDLEIIFNKKIKELHALKSAILAQELQSEAA